MDLPAHALEKKLWMGCGLLSCVSLLGLGFLLKSSLHEKNAGEVSGLSAAQVLQTHLNNITGLLLSYEETHDTAYLDQVKDEGAAVTETLEHCKTQAGNAEKALRLQHDIDALRSSVVALLSAETSQAGTLDEFLENLESARTLLPNRSANRALQMTELAKDLSFYLRTQSPEMLGAYRRTQESLKSFIRGSAGRRSKSQRLAGDFLAKGLENGHQVLQIEKDKGDALAEYQKTQHDVGLLLLELSQGSSFLPVIGAGREKAGIGLFMFLAFVVGLASFMMLLRVQLFGPLARLATIAEAASSGDLSRHASLESWNEIGRVCLAFNRLIGVLGRSENLIYHLAALVESSGEAIISLTLEGTILSWNKGAQRLYGYSPDEIKGRSVTRLAPKGNPQAFETILEAIKERRKIKPFEMNHEGKNGRRVRVVMRLACIYDSTRQVIGASLCLQDVPKVSPVPQPSEPVSHPPAL